MINLLLTLQVAACSCTLLCLLPKGVSFLAICFESMTLLVLSRFRDVSAIR